MNKVILYGNLGQDPEIRTLESGVLVARFTLATSESYQKDGEWHTVTEWHTITAWRGQAEKAEKQLKKGDAILVEGKIQYKKYTDSEGVARIATNIVVDHFTKAKGSNKSATAESWPSEADAPPPRNSQATTTDPVPANAETVQSGGGGAVDDLPF